MASVSVDSSDDPDWGLTCVLQHGVPRAAGRGARTEEARSKELKEIEQYQGLVNEINVEVSV